MDITERKHAEESVTNLNYELEERIAERTADLARINQALLKEIEERTQTERRLRQSESNLAEGQLLTKTGSWILDFKTGETDWSIETCRIVGFPNPPPSPHYREFRERVHPTDPDPVDRGLRESFETGEPRFPRRDGSEPHARVGDSKMAIHSAHGRFQRLCRGPINLGCHALGHAPSATWLHSKK